MVGAAGQPPDSLSGNRAQRTLPREARRRQLVESTIECIANRGLAETRMADVAAGAGMSVGIVNFHFDSKQALLAETLAFLSDEYLKAWDQARAAAPGDPVSQLEALIRMNFEPGICNPRRIAVWFAFFGAAGSRPTYQATCQRFDDEYLAQLNGLFVEVFGEAGRERARRAAMMLLVLWDGFWQNILLNPDGFDAVECQSVCMAWLRGVLEREAAP